MSTVDSKSGRQTYGEHCRFSGEWTSEESTLFRDSGEFTQRNELETTAIL